MELIEETEAEKEQGALPEPEPRYQTASLPPERTEHGQAWVRLASAIVLGVILIVLIVLLARWIYHAAHNNTAPNPPAVKTPAVSQNNPPAKPAPSSTPNTNSNNPPNIPSNSNTSPSQITNTGPGDVAAIFIGASLVAGGLHYLISVRRFAKS